jgi:hypothetical protein
MMTSKYLLKFDPFRDKHGFVIEPPESYAERIAKMLPSWPQEVIIEWLHRHNSACSRYESLGFENFSFSKVLWPLNSIPDRSAFWDPKFCDNFKDIERRATQAAFPDWLAQYMLKNGTWNTPPIFLENEGNKTLIGAVTHLKSPFHLLEGHRRVSFLNGLREIGKANAEHYVWVVKLQSET